jgi:putative ubiquitin-RnfH superfamily antitoxin RatB of RatAB toxin-antitoxin module
MDETMVVAVAYAEPGLEVCAELRVGSGTKLGEAINSDRLPASIRHLDFTAMKFGVWGKLKPASTILRDGDRIEIYRPLKADPNTARQHRVAKKRAAAVK